MASELGDKIALYYETLENEKRPRADRMKEVAEFLAPHRAINTEVTDNPAEEHYGENVYDGHPIDAVRKMVDGMFGNSVGPTSTWMEQMVVNNRERYVSPDLDQWMRDADSKMYHLFAISNFYRAIYQAIRDGVTLGNASTIVRANGNSISYKTVNPFHYFFEEDENQNLIIWMYRYPMTALKAWKMFGENIPQSVKEELDDENYTSISWYLYTVMENETASQIKGAKPSSQKPYVSAVKLLDGDNTVIHQGGFDECPVSVWQYYRESGEKWGRGPGDEAYFDTQYVNKLSQGILESTLLRATPPMQAPMEFKTQYNIKNKPKAVNYYTSPERQISYMQPGGEYQMPIDLLNRKDEIINYHFMVDFWTLLSRSTKRMTAYEVSETQGEKLSLLSFAIHNFFSEFVTPILERSYSLALDQELIPPPDPSWAGGVETSFKFNGLLAQAQRRSVEGSGMMRALQEIMPILEADPNAGVVVDWEQFIRRRFEINNVEASIIRNKEQVAAIKQKAQQMKAQKQQQEAVTEAAKSSDKPDFEKVMNTMRGGE